MKKDTYCSTVVLGIRFVASCVLHFNRACHGIERIRRMVLITIRRMIMLITIRRMILITRRMTLIAAHGVNRVQAGKVGSEGS